jgi:acetate kinase
MPLSIMTEANILVINAGSSTIKFAVFNSRLCSLVRGKVDRIDTEPRLKAQKADGTTLIDQELGAGISLHKMLCHVADFVDRHDFGSLAAIGHRVAIGGLEHSGPVLLDEEEFSKLEALIPLAPLHQPRNLEPIRLLLSSHPQLPQIACFDTAFHRTIPQVAQLYGLPHSIIEAGGRRYGFHGLSYEYISWQLDQAAPETAAKKIIVAHLGSGASLCALENGKSITTTMGFSPLSGLVMGTRPGDLDPGLMIWLLRERGMSIDEVETMLYTNAGMKGISGVSADMRDLLASKDPRSREAIELFVYKIASEIGAFTAVLGGLEALVFTAGIGEHSPEIRSMISARSSWLGLKIDEDANRQGKMTISTSDSTVTVSIVPTNEEQMIANHTANLLQKNPTAKKFP